MIVDYSNSLCPIHRISTVYHLLVGHVKNFIIKPLLLHLLDHFEPNEAFTIALDLYLVPTLALTK